jgi:hypothetical protein
VRSSQYDIYATDFRARDIDLPLIAQQELKSVRSGTRELRAHVLSVWQHDAHAITGTNLLNPIPGIDWGRRGHSAKDDPQNRNGL